MFEFLGAGAISLNCSVGKRPIGKCCVLTSSNPWIGFLSSASRMLSMEWTLRFCSSLVRCSALPAHLNEVGVLIIWIVLVGDVGQWI